MAHQYRPRRYPRLAHEDATDEQINNPPRWSPPGLCRLRRRRRLASLFFHGVPASRLIPASGQYTAAELGVRLIGVDRPGFGLSDFQHGRKLLDWPKDVAVLADTLGLAQFAIIGTSCGGPHALACAYALGERLTGAAVVSSMGQHQQARATRGMAWDYRLGWGGCGVLPGG
jgi:pimeloyl-ACP methyl ester carboxylesterase